MCDRSPWPFGTDQSAHRPARSPFRPPELSSAEVPRRRLEETLHETTSYRGGPSVAALGVVAATASASSGKQQANKLTVWLQVDAQSGWPDVVAAANQQFQSDHPGWTVDVQYQNWGDHLQKFDATIAGNNSPDVIEMGNTEMVEVHGGRRVRRHHVRQVAASRTRRTGLTGLAEVRHVRRQGLRRPVLRGLPCRHLPHRPLQEGRDQEHADEPRASSSRDAGKLAVDERARSRASRRSTARGTDWYFAMSFVYDFGGTIAKTQRGKWVGTLDSTQSIAGLTAFKNFFNATSKASPTSDENQSGAVQRVLAGHRRVDHRPRLVQLLRRQRSTRRPRRSS